MQCRGCAGRALASLALALLLASPGAGRLSRQHAVGEEELEVNPENFPVAQVVTLLTDMLASLKEDQTDDEEAYTEKECECKSQKKSLAADIKEAEETIANTNLVIEESQALVDKLTKEIAGHTQDETDENQALLDAVTLRSKGAETFEEEKAQLVQTIEAVGSARVVLSERAQEGVAVQEGSFLQRPQQALSKVSALIREQVDKHASLFQSALSPEQQRKVALLSNAQFPTYNNYESQTGEISGVLEQLQATFEADLDQAEEEEADAVKTFGQLSAVKRKQILASRTAIEEKTVQKAKAEETVQTAQSDKSAAEATLEADQASLAVWENDCKSTDDEWEDRKQTRARETAAVSEAISILNNDRAFKTFTNTFNPPASFLQETATVSTTQRVAASQILIAAAKQTRNPLLTMLSLRAKLDSFTRVKAAIGDMIADLDGQKEDDIAHKEWCTDANDGIASETKTKTDAMEELTSEQSDLNDTISLKRETIEGHKTSIRTFQETLNSIGDAREREHSVFEDMIKFQEETRGVLRAAIDVLEKFYGKTADSAAPASVPEEDTSDSAEETDGSEEEPVFTPYVTNVQPPVLTKLAEVMAEASGLITEARQAESAAQSAYEEQMKATNGLLEAGEQSLSTANQELAAETAKLSINQGNVDSEAKGLNLLDNQMKATNANCDFVISNFDMRQEAFESEIAALHQAHAMLSNETDPV